MSTWSTNLKIELIGTGEQPGTWGTTTNTNLGTALEQAIVGKADVTMSSASVTLNLTNTNALQDARALYLNLTGSPGGAAVLNVPAIQKPYIVKNGSDQQVTIKVAGQTGVAIPTSKTALVYNNGTDVTTSVDYIPSLTLGSALSTASGGTGNTSYTIGDILYASTSTTLSKLADVATGNALISGGVGVAPSYGKIGLTTHVSGVLPIANGGTNSSSTAYCNLTTNVTGTLPVANGGTGITSFGTGVATALGQNVTGSGGIALATSPVLTTPNIGTPSAGTLTSCTGLPLSTGVTGTLAVANGGTGQTTYTNGQLLIGNTTGNTLTKATLTAGTGISVTNGTGTITIGNTGVTSVTGTSPVASSGGATPAISLASGYGDTQNPYASKTANFFLASPDSTTGVPSFRAIVPTDVPTLNQNTTGNAATATYATSAGSVAYSNVSSRPDTGLYLVYDGVVSGGTGTSGTYTHVWTVLFGGGAAAKEIVSPDSFMVVTSLNDYYTSSNTSNYNSYTITKAINVIDTSGSPFNTRFTVQFIFSARPVPNQINVKIYVQSATAVTSLTLFS